MTVHWPTIGDLLTVLPEGFRGSLTGAVVERGLFDQPVAVSGQRAVVVPVTLEGKRFAVRFALTDPAPNRPRYDLVNQALENNPLLPLLSTRWEPTGVEIHGHRYPMVIMDWVEARPLADAVGELVDTGDLDGLASLTARLAVAFHDLEAAALVHGDLQHGNILVDESTVTLVDYDSVFMEGMPSHTGPTEAGHPNFRHPAATGLPGGRPNGDTFAATLIIASLNWLCARPELWRYHHGENLILDATDLENPTESELWSEIDLIDSATSIAYAQRVRMLLALDPTSPPPFSQAVALDQPFEDSGATLHTSLNPSSDEIPYDGTVVSTRASHDPPAAGQATDDRPTIDTGPPTGFANESVMPPPGFTANAPGQVVAPAAAPPQLHAPSEPTPTQIRDTRSPGVTTDATGPLNRRHLVVPLTIVVVAFVLLGAGATWLLLGDDGTPAGETNGVVKVTEDETGLATPDGAPEDDVDPPGGPDNTTDSSQPPVSAPPPTSTPTDPDSDQVTCDLITSNSSLRWLESPPRCLDYTASGRLPTSSIPNGWFVSLASTVMTEADAASRSEAQLTRFQAILPDAVRVDSRLYRGMRDPVWAIVVPTSSESEALDLCAYPELSGIKGCTARHTELTLDELKAGQRP